MIPFEAARPTRRSRPRTPSAPPWRRGPDSRIRAGAKRAILRSCHVIHRSAWNRNSRKFAVAISSALPRPATYGDAGGWGFSRFSAPNATFTARICCKRLRLATVQLPENFRPRPRRTEDQTMLTLLGRLFLEGDPRTLEGPPPRTLHNVSHGARSYHSGGRGP